MTSQWVWKTIGSSREAGCFRSLGPGCASLANMAIRSALANFMTLTIESLEGVPWAIGKKIWDGIKTSYIESIPKLMDVLTSLTPYGNRRLDSVHIWKLFAYVYLGVEDLKHRQHVILKPDSPFKSYIDPLVSITFHWITFLTLSQIICSRTDLLQLTKLKNLGVLTIGQGLACPIIGIDDSLVRAWGRAAAESDAFSTLRVFQCRSQKQITTKVLHYLNDFPSLALFTFEDCPKIGPQNKEEALRLGWRYKTGVDLSHFFAQSGATDASWDSISRASFRGSGPFSAGRVTAEGVEAFNNLPVLHFTLGSSADAAVNVTGAQGMRSFHRFVDYLPPPPSGPISGSKKRPLEQTSSQLSSLGARKKPTMRASKHQHMTSMLMGFGP